MNWWVLFGCKLTGWNSDVLAQCSEASRSQLSKYTSALVILFLILGITGFCFAQRYIGLPWWACLFVSLFFITIVIMIERQIILASEKTVSMVLFRGIIALIMAIVGSTIFDQTMFGKDIEKQMTNTIEKQVAELTPKRVRIIDEKLLALHADIDSLTRVNEGLQAEVNASPFIIQKSVTSTPNKIAMPDGTVKTEYTTAVTTNQVENPKQKIIDTNSKTLDNLASQEQFWIKRKQTIEEDTRKDCKASVGFLEELEAMWTIITTRKLAGGFYALFFFLLMSLEMFVVASKVGDKECDYDIAIKGAQRVRIAQFNNTFNRIGNQ